MSEDDYLSVRAYHPGEKDEEGEDDDENEDDGVGEEMSLER